MKCKKCGVELSENAKVCENCGALNDNVVSDVEIKKEEVNYNTESKSKDEKINEKDNKKANILSAISLALTIIPIILAVILSRLYINYDTTLTIIYVQQLIALLIGSLLIIMTIASFTLMIIVRVKYPQNAFGKILMWIYIAYATIIGNLCLIGLLKEMVRCFPVM